jgi:hypothetical protein
MGEDKVVDGIVEGPQQQQQQQQLDAAALYTDRAFW